MERTTNLFDVDFHRLDRHLKDQPNWFYEASIALADARSTYERARAARKLVEAEIDQDIRKNPEEYGLNKITEPALERMIVLQPKFLLAQDKEISARHGMDVCQALVDTLNQLKMTIENGCRLLLSSYFGEVKLPQEDGRKMADVAFDRAVRRKKEGGS